MSLKKFYEQLKSRAEAIREMAKVDVMGARREVDQLRREFVTALTHPMDMETLLWQVAGIIEIAQELDNLDKFDMPEEQPVQEDKAGNMIPVKDWATRQWARAGKRRGRDTSCREKPVDAKKEKRAARMRFAGNWEPKE